MERSARLSLGTLVRYTIVGGSSATLEFGIFYLLSERFGANYIYSNVLAVSCAVCYGFFLQKRWTFANKAGDARRQFMRWLVMAVASFALNNLLVAVLVGACKLPLGLAKILQLAITYAFNLETQRRFVFKADRV